MSGREHLLLIRLTFGGCGKEEDGAVPLVHDSMHGCADTFMVLRVSKRHRDHVGWPFLAGL